MGQLLSATMIAVGLGLLAPRVETALSGAGWEASGSESVQARDQLQREFGGAGSYALQVAVHSSGAGAGAPRLRRSVARVSISPETFAHPMRSTRPTAANSQSSTRRTGPKS